MCYARYWIVAVLVCIVFVSDLIAKRMPLEEGLTVLIDYEQYQKHVQPQRVRREGVILSNHTQSVHNRLEKSERSLNPRHHSNECDDDNDECEFKVCDDPVNEVYQKCGGKCVLGCRYAATSAGISLTISKHECEKNDCVEGCFCKMGLVRHQAKCIPASECPVRKCNHRYEVYMCGPAAPITCDNALREDEIVQLTKHVECVWGCFCAQGYLRNNDNGKCVPKQECRNTNAIDISPQIPGLFKHITGCGPKGCETNQHHHESGCGIKGCGSNHVPEADCGPKGCNTEGGHNQHTEKIDADSDSSSLESDSSADDNVAHHNEGGFQGPVTHIHQWNDTGKLELSGAAINGTCIGDHACSGEYAGHKNRGPGSVSSGTLLTTGALPNGTTITTPVVTGGTIDVATGTINTGATLNDEIDEIESEEAAETVAPQADIPMKVPIANKPETPTGTTPPNSNEMKLPQPPAQSSTPIEAPVRVANNKPKVPLQIPIAVTSPVKPINGNKGSQKPNSNNEAQPIYNLGQRPQFPFAPYIPTNFFANQQSPNSGIQTPFINPFTSFGNYPANPSFGYNPNVASNGAPNNAPNKAPNSDQNVQTLAAPYVGVIQPQFMPQNFYNKPIVAPNIQVSNAPNKDKVDAVDSSSEEEEDDDGGGNDEDESKSDEYESNSSEEPQQQNTQNAPTKKIDNVQTVSTGASGNKLPPNYQAYFNFLNQFKQNQGNPNQASANRIGSNQYIPQQVNQHQYNSQQVNQYQFNPNQASHGLNSNQFHQQFHHIQVNPNQLNLQPNPNLYYYPNNFNAPNTNGFPPQFTSPNAQYNQYNPYNNPFYTQSVNAFLNQANANLGNFPKPSNSYPTPNRPVITKPNRPDQAAANEKKPSTANQFYTNNRKVRPNLDKKEAEESVRPENKPQNSVDNQTPNIPDSNNENIQIQKNEEDSVS